MRQKTPSKSDLKHKFLIKIQSSALAPSEAQKLKFQPLSASQTEALGHKKVDSFKIPYFDLKGKPTAFYRLRYLDTTKTGFMKMTDAKDQRYDQLKNTINELYFPPLMKGSWEQYVKGDHPIIITEGELKAACATKMGFPTIGLGGVWCFRSAKNQLALLPVFKELNLAGKRVYIIFDSDAATNPNVALAENTLCKELIALKCEPVIVRLPAVDGKKTGLDDYLIARSVDEFMALMKDAEPYRLGAELHRLNEEVIYIENPSLVLRHKDFYKMSVGTFKNELFANRTYVDYNGEKPKTIKTADEWVRWQGRSSAARFVYEPGKSHLVNGALNLWQGLPLEPEKGDIQPWKTLLDYVFHGEPESRQWFERWCAYPFQHLGTKMYCATVMWSVLTGTGKTLIGHTMQRLYGPENSIMVRKRDLLNGNNSYAENKQFVLGEEITGSEKRELMDELKGLVTNEELRINIKYVPEYSIRSCINFYFTSNNPDAFLLDDTDRRFFIHEIRGKPLPLDFYKKIYDPWYKSDAGAAALLHYFMNLDLGDFDARDPAPMTASKRDMISNSQSALTTWIHELRENPDDILRLGERILLYSLWTAEALLALFDPEGSTRVSVRVMAVELKRAGFMRANNGIGCRTKSKQLKLWVIREEPKFTKMFGAALGAYYDDERKEKPKKFAAKQGE